MRKLGMNVIILIFIVLLNGDLKADTYIASGLKIDWVASATWGFVLQASKIDGSIVQNGCNAYNENQVTNTWYVLWDDANNDQNSAMYSTAMAAFITGRMVKLYGIDAATSCDTNGVQLYKIYMF